MMIVLCGARSARCKSWMIGRSLRAFNVSWKQVVTIAQLIKGNSLAVIMVSPSLLSLAEVAQIARKRKDDISTAGSTQIFHGICVLTICIYCNLCKSRCGENKRCLILWYI